MAVLPDNDRADVLAEYMRELSSVRDPCSVNSADIRAALNALDDLMNSNAAAINAAIPQPARANLTTAQKARLLMLVVRRRYISGA